MKVMARRKRWKPLSDVSKVKVGSLIRNKQGEEFRVARILGLDDSGILQVECTPLTLPTTIQWTGSQWRLAS
jgi:hypothetical protein